VDGRTVLVGSMNLDPRSDKLNTEMGLLVQSAPLADELIRVIEHACKTGAYRIGTGDDGRLRWSYTERDGRAVELAHEPRVSLLKRFGYKLLAPLAPEEML
jgi:putative cardiolipin synthase